MSETKSTLPMTTVPEFIYDERKDPIEQLQTYIFENKLLFDLYLEDIKDTEGHGSAYDIDFLDDMKADFLIGLKYLRAKDQSGYIKLGYVLYFKHSVVIVEKDLNPHPNTYPRPNATYQTEKIDHYYDLSNLNLNDLIDVVYGHDGRIAGVFKPRYPIQNNLSGFIKPYNKGMIIDFYHHSTIFNYGGQAGSEEPYCKFFNVCKNIQKPPIPVEREVELYDKIIRLGFSILQIHPEGTHLYYPLCYRSTNIKKCLYKLHKRSKLNLIYRSQSLQIRELQDENNLLKNKIIELEISLNSPKTTTTMPSTTPSLEADIEAILNDSYVVQKEPEQHKNQVEIDDIKDFINDIINLKSNYELTLPIVKQKLDAFCDKHQNTVHGDWLYFGASGCPVSDCLEDPDPESTEEFADRTIAVLFHKLYQLIGDQQPTEISEIVRLIQYTIEGVENEDYDDPNNYYDYNAFIKGVNLQNIPSRFREQILSLRCSVGGCSYCGNTNDYKKQLPREFLIKVHVARQFKEFIKRLIKDCNQALLKHYIN